MQPAVGRIINRSGLPGGMVPVKRYQFTGFHIFNNFLGIAPGYVDVSPAVGHVADPYPVIWIAELKLVIIARTHGETGHGCFLSDTEVNQPDEFRHE